MMRKLLFILFVFAVFNMTAQTTETVKERASNASQFESATKFSIFPNPGKNEMNISVSSLTNEGLELEVYDVLGKKVHVQTLNALSAKVNIAKWNSGLYLVRLSSSNQEAHLTKRFVKL
ncbi:T9SS type A sorting domain-containing protein [Lacinutrix neustonica]|uniref:T9SS type A sorting domain-containing protein n=1 Tax=Lacinutrix neustonica TaxID=2980107 RepID=A0A9E8MVZ8_9FLAO|nr:T9SS type A sorting domain-containing protein [Lacinutrix neustonica]WAC02071.1 T9SS type A sorting domain-containing protein [Lacinutrix neustonica]